MNGYWRENTMDICKVAREYFQKLFKSNLNSNTALNLDYIESCTSSEVNDRLLKDFTDNEIKEVFSQMDPRKALGIDVVGEDIIKLFHDILRGVKNVDCLNDTIIVLIPKIKEPVDMTNFRPISLCRVVYKIVAKVLANRLKETLPLCISQNESAFVPRRMIHDNILIAHKLVHYLQSTKNGPNKGFVIKLDMSKAYD
ncbi:reverse transcriptase [Gossypium australe]|uniref:Reverse transcriptase n=1 Tax=Gossypium australe TaxID=47621 RepID=A0A5B6UZW6_9ROSI|nr:reverse transcriptase [Gossypium australe]